MENAGNLNGFAWWCFENNVNLQEAETLSRKSVKLAEAGREKAMYLDTLAEICNSLGKHREAADLMKSAVAEKPDDDYYQKQLEKFEKLASSQN
jgi:S-methylmethionine-dependent homocysteine/selenocysteine methylase